MKIRFSVIQGDHASVYTIEIDLDRIDADGGAPVKVESNLPGFGYTLQSVGDGDEVRLEHYASSAIGPVPMYGTISAN